MAADAHAGVEHIATEREVLQVVFVELFAGALDPMRVLDQVARVVAETQDAEGLRIGRGSVSGSNLAPCSLISLVC